MHTRGLTLIVLIFLISQASSTYFGGKKWLRNQSGGHCYRNWNFDQDDIFEKAGVREPELSQVNYAKMQLIKELRRYFYQHSHDKWGLYQAVFAFKRIMDIIEQKYWSDINNIIIGGDNSVHGHDNFLHADGHTVVGNDNYVLHSNHGNVPLKDENVVRIIGFDIDFDEMELIKTDPCLAITKLKHHHRHGHGHHHKHHRNNQHYFARNHGKYW